MTCIYQQTCGGCPLRNLSSEEYRRFKLERFDRLVSAINQTDIRRGTPIFISDGTRRRAELTFSHKKGCLSLGFNAAQSHDLINIDACPLLTPKLNAALPTVRAFLQQFCAIKTTEKLKNKKFKTASVSQGEIWLTEAANGIDILLEIEQNIALEHRLLICDFAADNPDIIRVSIRKGSAQPETVIEKNKPHIEIGGRRVFIPAGTFLQASAAGEQALTDLVLRYVGADEGRIADLFCGVGTFSYPLSNNIKNKIVAVDSSAELLAGFQQSVNSQMIPNITIIKKNLFKYPLDNNELKGFDIIVFDPPRSGAAAQVAQIAALPTADKPRKVIAVSCNPHTFINDANTLIAGGYTLKEITMVDQFVYANHFELVALFEKL